MDIPISRKNNLRVAIIAIHGWKGNRSSMEHVANALDMKYAQWTFIQGPYAAGDNKYSWFKGNEKEGWKYQESFDLLHKTILDINKNGFPKGNVGDKFKVHLPKKYCEKGSNPVDAVVVDIPFTESYNPNTREVAK